MNDEKSAAVANLMREMAYAAAMHVTARNGRAQEHWLKQMSYLEGEIAKHLKELPWK